MKKVFAMLIAAVLVLSLAACGDSDKGKSSDSGKDSSAVEATQKAEETEAATEAVTEEPATEQVDDDTLIADRKKNLIGNWSYTGMEDYLKLVFNEDGTGSYHGIGGEDITFTYQIAVDHKEYGNGEPYVNTLLKMKYDTGETEDIIFWFNSETDMAFHNSDDGGYSGVLSYNEWIKQQ